MKSNRRRVPSLARDVPLIKLRTRSQELFSLPPFGGHFDRVDAPATTKLSRWTAPPRRNDGNDDGRIRNNPNPKKISALPQGGMTLRDPSALGFDAGPGPV